MIEPDQFPFIILQNLIHSRKVKREETHFRMKKATNKIISNIMRAMNVLVMNPLAIKESSIFITISFLVTGLTMTIIGNG